MEEYHLILLYEVILIFESLPYLLIVNTHKDFEDSTRSDEVYL